MAATLAGRVIKNPSVTIDFGSGAVDISDHVVAVELVPSAEVIDVGTFSAPYLQDVGRTTYSLVIAALWSEDLYVELEGNAGSSADLVITPDGDAGPATAGYFSVSGKLTALPIGRFEIGQKVEVDLTFAVTSEPAWTDSVET